MTKLPLFILCVDGFDPTMAKNLKTELPYNLVLSIPEELYEKGSPHTLHIWPSIFTGKPTRYNGLQKMRTPLWRQKTRRMLHKLGIRWYKTEAGRTTKEPTIYEELKIGMKVVTPEVKHTLMDEYKSYDFDLPGVSYSYVHSGALNQHKMRHRHWTHLQQALHFTNYSVAALYTSLLDYQGHVSPQMLPSLYIDVTTQAKWLIKAGHDVILVSDHGCVDGKHTDQAYLGCNVPVEASSVCDVFDELRRLLDT